MKKLESSFKNMVIVLTLITVIATGILAWMNQVTKSAIEKTNAAALKKAIENVVPDFDNDPVADCDTIKEGKHDYIIYRAKKGAEFIGAAVTSSSNGFGGEMKILVGFDPKGTIIDYSVLSHAETPGLGAQMGEWFKVEKVKGGKKEKSFLFELFFGKPKTSNGTQCIKGMNPGKQLLTVSKDGGQVDAITASTISSRAFLKAVNQAYSIYAKQYTDTKSGATKQNK